MPTRALPLRRDRRPDPACQRGRMAYWRPAAPMPAWRTPQLNMKLAAFRNRDRKHTSELQSHSDIVCRLLLEKKKIEDDYLVLQHNLELLENLVIRKLQH